MKAKRFILMMLVMLMSVTGAWADSVIFSYLFEDFNPDPEESSELAHDVFETWKIRTQNNIKISLGTPATACILPQQTHGVILRAQVHDFTVESLAPTIIINSIKIKYCGRDYITKENSITFPNGANNYQWEFDGFCFLEEVTVDYTNLHVHNYSGDWQMDATYHWHLCQGEGACKATVGDKSPHNYGESGAAYYTCSVCDYLNEARRSEYEARDYLSMTAVGGDVTIGMAKTGSPANYDLQYSFDKTDWTSVALTATNSNIVEIEEGQTCYFRHGSTTAIEKISNNQSNHWRFTMTSSDDATVEAGGNVMSMLDMTCQKNSMSGYPNQHMFTGLFKDCALLTVAPKLPATTIGQFCYMYMFEGTNITTAPELPATTIPDGAYNGMFRNCKKLGNVSPLPGTSLSRRAYNEMFYGCEKLQTVEIANITSMDSRDDSSNASFYNWLEGTAADTNGKVIAPIEMMGHALVFLPSNWQWATKLKANEDPTDGEEGNFYTTFYDSRYDYVVENGFKAYTGIITNTEDDERELRLTATPNNIIPKDHGVIIHGGSGEVLLTVSDGSAQNISGNVLTGSDTDTTAPDFCYILSYGQQGLGFYRYEDGKTLSAHKAYFIYEPLAAQAKALRMVFVDDEVDGIESISSDSANSPIGIYSVSGVRLNKLQKGINIVNGKKIIVK